jgi:hypothetical protein
MVGGGSVGMRVDAGVGGGSVGMKVDVGDGCAVFVAGGVGVETAVFVTVSIRATVAVAGTAVATSSSRVVGVQAINKLSVSRNKIRRFMSISLSTKNSKVYYDYEVYCTAKRPDRVISQ